MLDRPPSATVAARQHRRRRAELLGELDSAQDALAPFVGAGAAAPASRRRPRARRPRAAGRASAALRTTCSPLSSGPMQQSSDGSVFQTRPIERSTRYAWTSFSTRSAVRRSASSRSAIRLPLRKKFAAARSACGLAVDLARLQARDQLVGRRVDEDDLVGAVEEGVGQRLLDADAGDAADHVVEALEVLDVERRPDVDAGAEQLVDVLPALGVARSGDVGVRELVDEDQRRACAPARRRGRTPRSVPAAGIDLRGRISRPCSSAAVSARPCVSTTPTTTSVPCVLRSARRGEHREGLADASRRSRSRCAACRASRAPRRCGCARSAHRGRVWRRRLPRPFLGPVPGGDVIEKHRHAPLG